MKIHKGYTKSPWEWVRGTPIANFYNKETSGFFHVTTNVSEVMKKGLKPRKDLGDIEGLGGGPDDVISFTIRKDRAIWIWLVLTAIAEWAEDNISNSEILNRLFVLFNIKGSKYGRNIFEYFNTKQTTYYKQSLVRQLLHPFNFTYRDECDWLDILGVDSEFTQWEEITSMYHEVTKQDTFEAILRLDELVSVALHNERACVTHVGLFAKYSNIIRWKADQIAILQAVVRRSANIIPIYKECELRVKPEDIRLIGII